MNIYGSYNFKYILPLLIAILFLINPYSLWAQSGDAWYSNNTIASTNSELGDKQALADLYSSTNGPTTWKNRTGWSVNPGSINLSNPPFGVETEQINGEWRVVLIRLNNSGSGNPRTNSSDRKGNGLTGTLPNTLGNLKELRHWNVTYNNISGPLPGGMRYNTKLRYIAFEDAWGRAGLTDWGEVDEVSTISGNRGKWDLFNRPHNNFEGDLPPEWSDWKAPEVFVLANTVVDPDGRPTKRGVTSNLPPEWSAWGGSIKYIIMMHNRLRGALPKEWAAFTHLKDLMLDVNELGDPNGGPDAVLPAEWGGGMGYGDGMRRLRHLALNSDFSGNVSGGSSGHYPFRNRFNGPFPDNWKNIQMLHRFGWPQFNGPMGWPKFLAEGQYVDRVSVADPDPDAKPVEAYRSYLTEITNINNVTGEFPDIKPLGMLGRFNAAFNNFTGELPSDLSTAMRRIIQFHVGDSNMEGPIPDLSGWGRLRFAMFQGNNFTGQLPALNTGNSSFQQVRFDNNNLTGSIPAHWGDFPPGQNIHRIRLGNNNLSGPIPAGMAKYNFNNEFEVHGNRYLFKDLVPFIALGPNNFKYAPQQNFGSSRTYHKNPGESIKLDDFDTIVTQSGNRYQWQKNGSNISGATSRSLTLSNLKESDSGRYRLIVKNPGAPDLTLRSHEIVLNVGEGNGSGSGGSGGDGNGDDGNDDGSSGGDGNDDGNQDGDGSSDDGSGDDILTAPDLISPGNEQGFVVLSPELTWKAVENAEEYQVHVSTMNEMVIDSISDSGSFQINGELSANTTYYWRVRATNADETGSWSSLWSFTTGDTGDGDGNDEGDDPDILAAPVQVSPQDNEKEVINSITFEWKEVADADHYILHVSSEMKGGGLAEFFYSDKEGETIANTVYTVEKEAEPGQVLSWRVRAVKDDLLGKWSPLWSFSTRSDFDELQNEVTLNQNYPNPFNPSTQINFTIQQTQQVSLKVYDLAGRLVANLIDGDIVNAGSHEVTFNANSLASGIYFYRFVTESEIVTRKMTLMK